MKKKQDLILEYIRFQQSKMNLVDYCKKRKLPYLEFVEVVNRWNERYGISLVEDCMNRSERAGKWSEKNKYMPSTAERHFKELVLEPDEKKCRSHRIYPDNPNIYIELNDPKPDTIIRGATVNFPSGVTLSMKESTIKSLILAVVMYEQYGFRID